MVLSFSINNVTDFALIIFNRMHITTLLNNGIKTILFGKSNNTSLKRRLVYMRHVERKTNLKVAENISLNNKFLPDFFFKTVTFFLNY